MIIIKLQGGLGNQLFQYAAYSKLSEKFKVYFDVGEYNLPYDNGYRKFYLNFFNQGIRPKLCTFNDSRRNRLYYKFFAPYIKVFSNSIQKNLNYLNVGSGNNLSDNLDEIKDNSYVEGFFTNERFFSKKFIDTIDFSKKVQHSFLKNQYCSLLNIKNSVAIHIRRTDYIKNPDYEGICTSTYYKKALSYFNQKYPDTNFFFFSDDINWAKTEFGIKPNHYFVENDSSDDTTMRDLYLMSHCNHIVIANSSFSWWAAYLNKNKEKIVIHPEKYQNNSDTVLYSTSWMNITSINL